MLQTFGSLYTINLASLFYFFFLLNFSCWKKQTSDTQTRRRVTTIVNSRERKKKSEKEKPSNVLYVISVAGIQRIRLYSDIMVGIKLTSDIQKDTGHYNIKCSEGRVGGKSQV